MNGTKPSDELLPCPFCGSSAEEGTDDKWGSFVFCTDEESCNALQHNFAAEAGAIAAWNTRPAITALEERVAKLEGALTPSAATKAAYIGEFSFLIDEQGEDQMREVARKISVPWATIKEIMAAICLRAAPKEGGS